MNAACSTCLGSFTSISDISTTSCGHIFHTNCIERWLQSGQNLCPQCRKYCRQGQLIKLFFSEGESDNDIVKGLEETIRKLQEEVDELKSVKFVSNFEREEEKLKQNGKLKFQHEKVHLEGERLKLVKENLESRKENRQLVTHLECEKSNSRSLEKAT